MAKMAAPSLTGGSDTADRPAAGTAPNPLALSETSPSMAQYLEIKAANPQYLVWYRMGDFYELFFEDAVKASEALQIVLTKRGKHQGADIPMCGVPVVRADDYLQRLIRSGFRVAVCEQLEDPAEARKRGSKSVVRRDVVRLVTPGTLTEDALLDARSRNYLTALFASAGVSGILDTDGKAALASVDISTGELEICECAWSDIAGELVRLSPSEVLVSDTIAGDGEIVGHVVCAGARLTPVPAISFDSRAGERDLKAHLAVLELGGFGTFSRAELSATAAVLRYIDLTQMGARPALRPPRRGGPGATLVIDAASRISLELAKSTGGDKDGSLLAAIDRTVTGAGARELQARMTSPLAVVSDINARLDVLTVLTAEPRLLEEMRSRMRGAPDFARPLARLGFNRGGPRDLGALRDGLAAARSVRELVTRPAPLLEPPALLFDAVGRIAAVSQSLIDALSAALNDDLPHLTRDGSFVRTGFDAALDAARHERDNGRGVMAALEARYQHETGIKTLKVRHNNILGYFIEVTQLAARPLMIEPLNKVFRHRQTMANAARFSTPELLEAEGAVATASERALNIELEIFNRLCRSAAAEQSVIGAAAGALAELDVYGALACLAIEQNYVRPTVDVSQTFDIRGGRHPVVEQALAKSRSAKFIENDCVLAAAGESVEPAPGAKQDAPIWLVTGPNMAGKSTFLRANALITVLAQMGSFVPARRAHIGIVDRLFSRVGAADDLARGRSTFMVEMVETAAILNQATNRSLVILDEIGRGTATFDGLSIAWATVEFLQAITKPRVLFATHYHELTALARRHAEIANVTMDVAEWQDTIVFLHKVKPGAADRSYGIQVAKLAGFPSSVIARARDVLARLEKTDRSNRQKNARMDELPLFAVPAVQAAATPNTTSEIEDLLADISPDELSPKAALDVIYRLKALAASRASGRDPEC